MRLIDDTRTAWRARPSTWTASQRAANTVPRSQRTTQSWHWDGPYPVRLFGREHQACLDRVRAIQGQHQAKGWADIGYNLLICPHGRVIEGRGIDLKGAHSPGVNWVSIGTQFMLGQGEHPNAAMLARARQLANDVAFTFGRTMRQWGHRDDPEAATTCPGDELWRWVHQGLPAPSTTTPPTQEKDEFDMATSQEVADLVWARMVNRTEGRVSAIQELADAKTQARANGQAIAQLAAQLSALDVVDEHALGGAIASAIGPELREAIVAELAGATAAVPAEAVADAVLARLQAISWTTTIRTPVTEDLPRQG